jgi:hypothetical protein
VVTFVTLVGFWLCKNEATPKNFIYKCTPRFGKCTKNKEKGEFIGHQISCKLDFKRLVGLISVYKNVFIRVISKGFQIEGIGTQVCQNWGRNA